MLTLADPPLLLTRLSQAFRPGASDRGGLWVGAGQSKAAGHAAAAGPGGSSRNERARREPLAMGHRGG